jgi:NAD(P)-dependent dehydrogenase (short-subunit alcohol dehydrogenase family)
MPRTLVTGGSGLIGSHVVRALLERQRRRHAPHEDAIEATVGWYREREGDKLAGPGARQPLQLRAAGLVARQLGGAVGRLV